MLDPTAWQRRALSKAKATGPLAYSQLLKSIAVNSGWSPRNVDWQQAYQWFDGLDSPYNEVDFFADGTLHSVSTASVLRINEGEQRAARADGRALLDRLIASGHLVTSLNENVALRPWETYRQQYLLNAGTGSGLTQWVRDPLTRSTDPRINAPERFLTEYPIQGDLWNGSRDQSLTNLPIPRRGGSQVFIGPSFWRFTGEGRYTMEQMADDMTEALAIIVRLHKSANTHPGMSPALFFGTRSPDWTDLLQQNVTVAGFGETTTFARQLINLPSSVGSSRGEGYFAGVPWVERSIGYFPSRFFLPMTYDTDPSDWDFRIMGTSNELWRQSASSRQRRWATLDAEATTADAVVDYAQIFNLLEYFVELPPQVTLMSAMYFHNFLFRTSYLQVGAPYGTNFAQYRQRLNAEYRATSNATAAEKALSGFDFTNSPTSLEGRTVFSLALALAAFAYGAPAGIVGGIIALGLTGIGALIEDMSRDPPRYNPDPGRSLLRDNWRRLQDNNFWRNYTPDTVIRSRPCIIYE